jgi:hypothetical protein
MIRYGQPLKLTIEGPVGNGRTGLVHDIWMFMNKCKHPALICKQTGEYELTIQYPLRLVREKPKAGVLYKPYIL